MNILTEKGVSDERLFGKNLLYILSGHTDFQITEYKVLQSQNGQAFVPCTRINFNGKTSLYYQIDGRRSLSEIIDNLDGNNFVNLVSNLLKTIVSIDGNGFLTCCNINFSSERLYVDVSNMSTSLIYLPIQRKIFSDKSDFECSVRNILTQEILTHPKLQSPIVESLKRALNDSNLSFAAILSYVRKSDSQSVSPGGGSRLRRADGEMRLESVNTTSKFILNVDSDEYIIGSRQGSVNGLISFNKAISRVHCKIIRSFSGYKVEDLGSANGTFVNNKRIKANYAVPISSGDLLRLANCDFRVVIE